MGGFTVKFSPDFSGRRDAGGSAASEPTKHPRKRGRNVSSLQEDRLWLNHAAANPTVSSEQPSASFLPFTAHPDDSPTNGYFPQVLLSRPVSYGLSRVTESMASITEILASDLCPPGLILFRTSWVSPRSSRRANLLAGFDSDTTGFVCDIAQCPGLWDPRGPRAKFPFDPRHFPPPIKQSWKVTMWKATGSRPRFVERLPDRHRR